MSAPALIYWQNLAGRDGTSIQLARLFAARDERPLQLHWGENSFGTGSASGPTFNCEKFWRLRRGASYFARLHRIFPASIVRPLVFQKRRFQREFQATGLAVREARIVVSDEHQSIRALDLHTALGRPPSLLHVMDWLEPLAPYAVAHPSFAALARGASRVACISQVLADAVGRFAEAPPLVVPACALSDELPIQPSTARSGVLRVFIGGTIYAEEVAGESRILQQLAEVWPQFLQEFGQSAGELIYAGQTPERIPAILRPFVTDLGVLVQEECLRVMQGCDLAIVTMTYSADSLFRFSVPARISDFLLAGLPVIAMAVPRTGLYEMLQSLEGKAAHLVSNSAGLLSVLRESKSNPARIVHEKAAARKFALDHLGPKQCARRLAELIAV